MSSSRRCLFCRSRQAFQMSLWSSKSASKKNSAGHTTKKKRIRSRAALPWRVYSHRRRERWCRRRAERMPGGHLTTEPLASSRRRAGLTSRKEWHRFARALARVRSAPEYQWKTKQKTAIHLWPCDTVACSGGSVRTCASEGPQNSILYLWRIFVSLFYIWIFETKKTF